MTQAGGRVGLAVQVRVDDMAATTAALTQLLDSAGGEEPLVLELTSQASDDAVPWPGPVETSEVNRWERALRRLETASAPTIAAIRGRCSGPMLELALACDLRVGDEHAEIDLSHLSRWPGMAVLRLCRLVGVQPARVLVLTGGHLTAAAARARGLLDATEPSIDDAMDVFLEQARRTPDYRVTRQLLLEAATTAYDEALGAHLAACDRRLRASDEAGLAP